MKFYRRDSTSENGCWEGLNLSYYRKHIFVCMNQRDNGKACCGETRGGDAWAYCKQWVADQGLAGQGGIRVSRAGCLGRCALGPCLVIYPEGVWYTYGSDEDIKMILEQHLIQGKDVPALMLP